MNEKIKQLAEQAYLYNEDDNFLTAAVEELARLIVSECVEICNQANLMNQDTLSKLGDDELAEKMIIHGSIKQAQKLADGIKQHFGVEE
jgi:arginine decarboxylase-like protein